MSEQGAVIRLRASCAVRQRREREVAGSLRRLRQRNSTVPSARPSFVASPDFATLDGGIA
jgi:hypothetical protein